MSDPIQVLMDEHRVIERVLGADTCLQGFMGDLHSDAARGGHHAPCFLE